MPLDDDPDTLQTLYEAFDAVWMYAIACGAPLRPHRIKEEDDAESSRCSRGRGARSKKTTAGCLEGS